jgi:hypothetical protein
MKERKKERKKTKQMKVAFMKIYKRKIGGE